MNWLWFTLSLLRLAPHHGQQLLQVVRPHPDGLSQQASVELEVVGEQGQHYDVADVSVSQLWGHNSVGGSIVD